MMDMDILWSAMNLNSNYMQLVGGIPTPLINMSSSVGMMKLPKYGEKNKCSKPPTRYTIFCVLIILFERPIFLATPGSFWLKLWVDVRTAPCDPHSTGVIRLISKDFTEHSKKWFSPPVDDKHLHISYIKQNIHRSPIYHNRFHFTTIMVAQIHAGLIYITAIGMGRQWIYASFEHAASPLCSSPGAVWQWWGKSTRVVTTINQLSYLGGPTL